MAKRSIIQGSTHFTTPYNTRVDIMTIRMSLCSGRGNCGGRGASCIALAHDSAPLKLSPIDSTPVLGSLIRFPGGLVLARQRVPR